MGSISMDEMDMPRLEKTPTSSQLVVHGKPFLMLGAELQNSSMSTAAYMRTAWPKLVEGHINTVLGAVTWEDIEPTEGNFDFSELSQVITDARHHGLHLIVLWFGSFKNGMSTYIPHWVKKDHKRFPRARVREADGRLKTVECLSLFGQEESCRADAKAFSALMAFLNDTDRNHSTVIMVQVENEVGFLGDSRDRSPAAEKAFEQPVPSDLTTFLLEKWSSLHPFLQDNLKIFHALAEKGVSTTESSWESVFGASQHTDEVFMAYHYAKYVEAVAVAGHPHFNVPLYTNVWMNYVGDSNEFPSVAGGGGCPGDYPSGGAVINTLDIWHRFAPTLSFISPDIYLNDYVAVCAGYRHNNQPLMIPEQRRDEHGARRIWSAIGTHLAIGVSPFGIDTLEVHENLYVRHYKLLQSVAPIVLEAQRKPGTSFGFFFDEFSTSEPQKPWVVTFGDLELTIERAFVFGTPGPGSGMVIWKGGMTFLLLGWGYRVTFRSTKREATFTGILRFDEKEVADAENGDLRTARKLNGDETRAGLHVNMPNEDPDYGGFPIAITIPSRTMLAEVEVYTLEEED